MDPHCLRLVAITDNLRDGVAGLVRRAAAAERGGATMVHLRLRDESPRTLVQVGRALVAALAIPVLVHDRADIALAAGAAGVHLGVRELAATTVRRLAPAAFIIGASIGSEDEIGRAEGADYVGIGPVFAAAPGDIRALGTQRFAELARRASCPAVAIGGIAPGTAPEVMSAGAVGVAVISGIFAASDPAAACQAIRDASGR